MRTWGRDNVSSERRTWAERVVLALWAVCLAAVMWVALSGEARGQMPAAVHLDEEGLGETFIMSQRPAMVQVRLWQAQPGDGPGGVELVAEVPMALVWPQEFPLGSGGRQTVRIRVPPGQYPEETVLRLETILTPLEDAEGRDVGGGVQMHLTWRTRYLTKVHVGGADG